MRVERMALVEGGGEKDSRASLEEVGDEIKNTLDG